MKSFFRFLLLLVILGAGFSALAIYWTFVKPLPNYQAEIHLDELRQQVEVYWDEYGVPSIFAENEHDLYTTLGYLHAQDRLWQMTVVQLFVEGRFSEFFGEDLLDIDRFSRTVGFWRTAAMIENELDTTEIQLLNWYSNGINRFVSENRNRLPVEFALTGVKPLEWTPQHSIALSRLLGWELNVTWWSKIMLGYLESYFQEPVLQELFPQWPVDSPRNLNLTQTRQLLSTLIPVMESDRLSRSLYGNLGTHIGSNAWVSDGSLTTSGYPLLAGDPHLGLDMPGKWYEVHMNLNGRNLAGATIPGAPLIIMGQNDFLAWSFTSLMGDDTDFYIELGNPENRGQYLADSVDGTAIYKDFSISREIIRTKQGNEVIHEIRLTQNGPIISDIYPNQALLDGRKISMRWVGHDFSNEIKSLHTMAWSSSIDDFRQALQGFGIPSLNIIYGDVQGNIAMFTAGKIPIRSSPTLLFRNGWNSAERWSGFIPEHQLPRLINPEKGFIANANNPVVSDNYPYYLTSFWEPDSRIRRIENILSNSANHDAELFKSLQNDVFSHHAKDLVELILPVLERSEDSRIRTALPYLRNWNFNYDVNATAASLTDVFFLKLIENTFKPYLGEAAFDNFLKLENFPVRVTQRLLRTPSVWFQSDGGSITYQDSLITTSMKQSVDFLTITYGEDPSRWRWGNLHTITLAPPLFREAASDPSAPHSLRLIVTNLLSKGPFEIGGHSMSVNNTQYDFQNPFEQVLGASIRRIVDLSNTARSESVLPTGQSGNPLSSHFGDQTQLWLTGKYRIFNHNNDITDDARYRKMTLTPR
jgi:penicillin G amidase